VIWADIGGNAHDIDVLQITHILHLTLDKLENDAEQISVRTLGHSYHIETGSPLALLLRFDNFRPRVLGNQIMPLKLARRTPAHRMLERLQHARCLQILERLHGLHQKVRVRILVHRLLRNSFKHVLVLLHVL
jgi:hypothetical protein